MPVDPKVKTLAEGPLISPLGHSAPRPGSIFPRKRQPTRPRGHAYPPGTGPEGQTCGTCRYLVANVMRSGRCFLKCGLNKHNWTGGPGSDVRAKHPACRGWEEIV